MIYRDPFNGVYVDGSQIHSRKPEVDKCKIVINFDFDETLQEFDDE